MLQLVSMVCPTRCFGSRLGSGTNISPGEEEDDDDDGCPGGGGFSGGGSGEKPRERSLSAMRRMAESGTVVDARGSFAAADAETQGVIERPRRRKGKKGLGLGKTGFRVLGGIGEGN